MVQRPDISLLELLVLSSAPSPLEYEHEGWLIRLGAGDIKRGRSVTALADAGDDVEARIAWCEQLFTEHGLPSLFRLSPASQPSDLDRRLAARGYEVLEPTLVQVLGLSTATSRSEGLWECRQPGLERWAEEVALFRGLSAVEHNNHQSRLQGLRDKVAVFGAFDRGQMIGSGAVVVEGAYTSVQDMHTRQDYRRRGIAEALLRTLLENARSRGADFAWLGVLEANEPARRLYAKFGFETAYSYWYRQKG